MEIELKEAEVVISDFPEKDHFIDAHLQQGLGGHNEYWDNSMELAEYWTKCKQIIDSQ